MEKIYIELTEKIKKIFGAPKYYNSENIDAVTDNIFISSNRNIKNIDNLDAYEITCIINISNKQDDGLKSYLTDKKIIYENFNTKTNYNDIYWAIMDYSSLAKKILVCCDKGEDTSFRFLVAYYLRRYYAIKYLKANNDSTIINDIISTNKWFLPIIITLLYDKRQSTVLNEYYIQELISYEIQLKELYNLHIETS